MKKSIFVLALISIAMLFIVPRVYATDKDVGSALVMPADNAISIAFDCQVSNYSFECVTQVAVRDPGDMRLELRAESSGLKAESPRNNYGLPQGDLTDLYFCSLDRHGTRLNNLFNKYIAYTETVSTSNGGAGY